MICSFQTRFLKDGKVSVWSPLASAQQLTSCRLGVVNKKNAHITTIPRDPEKRDTKELKKNTEKTALPANSVRYSLGCTCICLPSQMDWDDADIESWRWYV